MNETDGAVLTAQVSGRKRICTGPHAEEETQSRVGAREGRGGFNRVAEEGPSEWVGGI